MSDHYFTSQEWHDLINACDVLIGSYDSELEEYVKARYVKDTEGRVRVVNLFNRLNAKVLAEMQYELENHLPT